MQIKGSTQRSRAVSMYELRHIQSPRGGRYRCGPRVRKWHETDMPKYLGDVRCWVNSGKHLLSLSFSGFDPMYGPAVRCKRFSSSWRSAVLHQCIRSLIGADLLRTIMDISARAISLADRPQRAIRVTSVRIRREDRSSISSHPLADLGG
jgi:hypothetical protein